MSPGAGREVLGHPWNVRSAEEDLHKGPLAREATYQAWLVIVRKLVGWGTEGLGDWGALGRLFVPLTMQLVLLGNWDFGAWAAWP